MNNDVSSISAREFRTRARESIIKNLKQLCVIVILYLCIIEIIERSIGIVQQIGPFRFGTAQYVINNQTFETILNNTNGSVKTWVSIFPMLTDGYYISRVITALALLLLLYFLIQLLKGPMELGYEGVFLENGMDPKKEVRISSLFEGFKNFGKAIGLYVYRWIFLVIWGCIFAIPGMIVIALLPEGLGIAIGSLWFIAAGISVAIAYIRYCMAFLQLKENPQKKISECLNDSKNLMTGKVWKYFCLMLSFIGWQFLVILVLALAAGPLFAMGIEFMEIFIAIILTSILQVYMQSSKIEFYKVLTGKVENFSDEHGQDPS